MAESRLKVILETSGTGKIKSANRDVNTLKKSTQKLNGTLGKTSSASRKAANGVRKFGGAAGGPGTRGVKRLTSAVSKLLGALAILEGAKFVFRQTAELETQRKSLEVLTKSAKEANEIIKELQSFSNVTPFTSSELISTAKRLKAFGVDTEKLVETTKRLGDVAGATGADLSGIATAYGQIIAKGRLQGEELLQLQERGIALQPILQREYNLTGEEFRKVLENGKISAEAVEFAFKKLTSTSGDYFKGATAQAETLNGKLSTLVDGLGKIAQVVGQLLEPAFKGLLTVINDNIQKLLAYTKLLGDGAILAARIKVGIPGDDVKDLTELANAIEALGKIPANQEFVAELKIAAKDQIDFLTQFGILKKNAETGLIDDPALAAAYQTALNAAKELLRVTPKIKEEIKEEIKPPLNSLTGDEEDKGKGKTIDELLGKPFGDAARIKIKENELQLETEINEAKKLGNDEEVKRLQNELALVPLRVKEEALVSGIYQIQTRSNELLAQGIKQETIDVNLKKLQNELTLTQLDLKKRVTKQTGEQIAAEKKLEEVYFSAGKTLGESLAAKIKDTAEESKILSQVWKGFGNEVQNVFDALIDGTQDWNAVLKDTLRSLAKVLATAGFNALGQSGGFLGQLFGGPKATGGPVSGGTSYLVGEKGPELFTPSSSGNITPNSALGGNTVVNITVNDNGGGSASSSGPNSQQAAQLARLIESSTLAIINREKRPGGTLSLSR